MVNIGHNISSMDLIMRNYHCSSSIINTYRTDIEVIVCESLLGWENIYAERSEDELIFVINFVVNVARMLGIMSHIMTVTLSFFRFKWDQFKLRCSESGRSILKKLWMLPKFEKLVSFVRKCVSGIFLIEQYTGQDKIFG